MKTKKPLKTIIMKRSSSMTSSDSVINHIPKAKQKVVFTKMKTEDLNKTRIKVYDYLIP